MTGQIILWLIPEGAFLLGGVSFNPAYDAVTALDNNLPYLTPTSLKGAIRIDFETFVRGILQVEKRELPQTWQNFYNLDICDIEKEIQGCEKERCIFCSLFGGGNKEGKLRFQPAFLNSSHSQLSEATADVKKAILEKGKREGVSISREMGKARDGSYYSYLTFPDMAAVMPISFEVRIDIREPLSQIENQLLELFFVFLSRTGIFIGARKSVGLGHFKVKYRQENSKITSTEEEIGTTRKPIDWKAQGEKPVIPPKVILNQPGISSDGNNLKLFLMKLETCEPLVAGHIKNLYITDTLPYLPATVIGGGIGFALTGSGIPGEIVNSLFIEKKLFSPFNFYYQEIENNVQDQKDEEKSLYNSPYPLPASMRSKKGDENRILDTLLQDYIVKRGIEAGKFQEVEELFEMLYRQSLRPVSLCKKPETSFITRLAINRELQKNMREKLYSMEVINKGTVFYGLVIAESWIMEILEKIEFLYLGGKRSRGFGRTRITTVEALKDTELIPSKSLIDKELRNLAHYYGIEIPVDRIYYTLDSLTDIGPVEHKKSFEGGFETCMQTCLFPGLELKIEKAFPLLMRSGGYGGPSPSEREEKPLKEKIAAGSTFLVSVPKEKEGEFIKKVEDAVKDSIKYDWDSTVLFRLNNPQHTKIWREKCIKS